MQSRPKVFTNVQVIAVVKSYLVDSNYSDFMDIKQQYFSFLVSTSETLFNNDDYKLITILVIT